MKKRGDIFSSPNFIGFEVEYILGFRLNKILQRFFADDLNDMLEKIGLNC